MPKKNLLKMQREIRRLKLQNKFLSLKKKGRKVIIPLTKPKNKKRRRLQPVQIPINYDEILAMREVEISVNDAMATFPQEIAEMEYAMRTAIPKTLDPWKL